MKNFPKGFRFFKRRNGFTLVELLIVSAIIGILAGMMMIVMGPSTGGAKASALLYDLRSVKAATMQYFYDHGVMPSDGLSTGGSPVLAANLEKYMDKVLDANYGGLVYYMEYDGKTYYGLLPQEFTESAQQKLKKQEIIYKTDGSLYDGGPGPYYMPVK
jgi:prepilin-type N-terminal cleavage/methylation domain-containing protein